MKLHKVVCYNNRSDCRKWLFYSYYTYVLNSLELWGIFTDSSELLKSMYVAVKLSVLTLSWDCICTEVWEIAK